MKKQTILTGYLLILASILFVISWWLMPDPGTTDTLFILKAVKQSRSAVLNSVIVQIISSVLYIAALFLLVKITFPKTITMVGIILFGIGVMGFCADAFFHLLAYFMTDETVHIQQDVVQVMDFMQTTGIVVLLPILLPFFIGSIVTAIGLHKQYAISKIPFIGFIIFILIAFVAGIFKYTGPAMSLFILGVFAISQAWIGVELIKRSQAKVAFN